MLLIRHDQGNVEQQNRAQSVGEKLTVEEKLKNSIGRELKENTGEKFAEINERHKEEIMRRINSLDSLPKVASIQDFANAGNAIYRLDKA